MEPTTEVDFLLHNSLPDRNPTTVTRERRFINPTQYLISCQRCSARAPICQKSFGISAVRKTRSVSLSTNALTSMRFSQSPRENMGIISEGSQLSQFWIRSGNLSTGPGAGSQFSLIGRAGYIFNRDRLLGPSAMSGARRKPSFSKVRPSSFQALPPLTSCRRLRKARG